MNQLDLRDTSVAALQDFDYPIVTEKKSEKPLGYVEPRWWNDLEIKEKHVYETKCRMVVKAFLTGTFPKKMDAHPGNGRHFYKTDKAGTELWLFKDNPSLKRKVLVAKKVGDFFIGNSSSLFFQRTVKGDIVNTRSLSPLKIQECLSQAIPMIPFQVFKDARLDINSFRVIEKGPSEQVIISAWGSRSENSHVRNEHYTGAMLFKIQVRSRSVDLVGHKDEYYLFDIDRNDLRLRVLNPFLAKLSRPCKSIKDAYDSLKPNEVREAEKFLKTEVQRQGEWFFIPVQGEFKHKKEPTYSHGLGRPRRVQAVLESKGNRPHYVEFLSEEGYVTGKVTHGGFEHKPITLEGWHKPVPNTAIESFKISGAID